MSDRKSPVRLTDDERYMIYKFCIENHCVLQNGELFNYRVDKTQTAKEINAKGILNGRFISAYHVSDSVESVIAWGARLNKLPEPQETMEMEQLRIQHTKNIKQIEEQKISIENGNRALKIAKDQENELAKQIMSANKRLADAQEKLNKIKAIIS